MRGKPHQRVMPPAGRRIIPAHAGQTRALARPDQRRTDHPRACGANLIVFGVVHTHLGSSPRMRGKRRFSRSTRRDGRIIPAHAGQTVCGACSTSVATDHPRACGANFSTTVLSCVLFGSSPRMRGKPWWPGGIPRHPRIIPAHAGQTHGGVIVAVPSTDHPRACGANPNTVIPVTATAGSSPRMRGKLQRYLQYIR